MANARSVSRSRGNAVGRGNVLSPMPVIHRHVPWNRLPGHLSQQYRTLSRREPLAPSQPVVKAEIESAVQAYKDAGGTNENALTVAVTHHIGADTYTVTVSFDEQPGGTLVYAKDDPSNNTDIARIYNLTNAGKSRIDTIAREIVFDRRNTVLA